MYLLDTNIVSELGRPAPNAGVVAWVAATPEDAIFLSVVVLQEISKGIELKRAASEAKARALEASLATLKGRFGDRILPIDADTAEESGRLLARRRTMSVEDAHHAATAITRGLILATHNTRDFLGAGVSMVDPFDPGSYLPGTGERGPRPR